MLKISLKQGQYVNIGDNIRVVYVGGTGNHGRLMIDAPTQASTDLSEFLEFFNDPSNKKKYMFNTNLERELLFYFDKISDEDKKEIIEFTKIKARKPL